MLTITFLPSTFSIPVFNSLVGNSNVNDYIFAWHLFYTGFFYQENNGLEPIILILSHPW